MKYRLFTVITIAVVYVSLIMAIYSMYHYEVIEESLALSVLAVLAVSFFAIEWLLRYYMRGD